MLLFSKVNICHLFMTGGKSIPTGAFPAVGKLANPKGTLIPKVVRHCLKPKNSFVSPCCL
jgi:hypothetical protein